MVHIAASIALAISAAGFVSANPISARTLTIPLTKTASKSQISGKDIVAKEKARIAKYNGARAAVGPSPVCH